MSQPTLSQFTRTPTDAEERLLPYDDLGRTCYNRSESDEDVANCTQYFDPSIKWARLEDGTLPCASYTCTHNYWVKWNDKDGMPKISMCYIGQGAIYTTRPISSFNIAIDIIDIDRVIGVIPVMSPFNTTEVSDYEPLGNVPDEERLEEIAKERSKEDAAEAERE